MNVGSRTMQFARKPPKLGLRILARVVLVGMTLGLSVAAGEIVVRLVSPQPASWLDIYRLNSAPPYALKQYARSFCDTGESKWTVYTDGEGHRTSSYPPRDEKPGATRVLMIGDSFTFGSGVDHEHTFVGLLDGCDDRYQFINAGVNGYGPTQYRQVLEQEIGREPAPCLVIVATFLGNDIYDCIWSKNFPMRNGILGNPGGLWSWIKRRSHLYRLIARTWHQVTSRRRSSVQLEASLFSATSWEGGDLDRGIRIYEQEFARMAEICVRRKIRLFACIIPTASAVEAAEAPFRVIGGTLDHELPARKVRSIFERLGIPNIDLTSSLAEMGRKRTYFPHDGHLTPLGNRVIAENIRMEVRNLKDVVEFSRFRPEPR